MHDAFYDPVDSTRELLKKLGRVEFVLFCYNSNLSKSLRIYTYPTGTANEEQAEEAILNNIINVRLL